jgi:hypothetical protein
MNLGNIARVVTVAAACLAALGSATSSSHSPAVQPHHQNTSPPPPQEMDPSRALGLWRSTFGAVKIEADNSRGGIASGAIQGIWVYPRQGQEVIGYFHGSLRGNVLDFRWQEPGIAGAPPLVGAGYLVFELTGRQYAGRWWTDKRDRVGDWNGWRQANTQQPQYGVDGGAQYGGQPYGGAGPDGQPSPHGDEQPGPYGQPQQPRAPYPTQQPPPQQPSQPQPYYPQQPQPYYPPPR